MPSEEPTPSTPVDSSTTRRNALRTSAQVFGALAGGWLLGKSRASAQPAPSAPLPLAYEFVPSPNCDDRPPGTSITCVVLHSTVEPTTEGTMKIFLDSTRRVSAHFVVGRDGRVVQMVSVEKRAWHAGESVLDGVPRVNDYSVGIEMVNLNDGKDPYTEPQVQAVAGIIRFLRSRYTITDEHIVSHAQIALPPGRKSDPLNFDFNRIRQLAQPNGGIPSPEPATPAPPPAAGKS